MPVPYCFGYSHIVILKLGSICPPNLLLFLKIAWASVGPLPFCTNFRVNSSIFTKNCLLGRWSEMHWIFQSVWGEWPSLQYCLTILEYDTAYFKNNRPHSLLYTAEMNNVEIFRVCMSQVFSMTYHIYRSIKLKSFWGITVPNTKANNEPLPLTRFYSFFPYSDYPSCPHSNILLIFQDLTLKFYSSRKLPLPVTFLSQSVPSCQCLHLYHIPSPWVHRWLSPNVASQKSLEISTLIISTNGPLEFPNNSSCK